MRNFVILIPSFNESKTLNNILKKIRKYNVYVIDDCSTDSTKKLNKRYSNVKFVFNKKNIGYELTLFKGLNILKNKKFDYVITMDADGEHSISNIKKIMYFCKKNSPDLVIGNRSRKNRLFEKIISLLFNKRYKILDPLCGFKAYRLKTLKPLIRNYKIKQHFFIDILNLFIKEKLNIFSINIKSSSKPKRKSKVGGTLSSNLKIISCLVYLI